MRFLIFSLCASLILYSCKVTQIAADKSLLYSNAIEDAMYVEKEEIDSNLIAITSFNQNIKRKIINDTEYVLVLSWIPQKFKYPDTGKYNTDNRETWVTVYPELLETMRTSNEKNVNLRLQQLLGLPPTDPPNKLFIEFWVKPDDLFRPCPDKEIADSSCNLCFSKEDSLDKNHIEWITNKRLANYNCDGLFKHYPWTALGYTYDWNPENKNHKGLSEFIIKKNSIIYVKRIIPTEEYLKEPVY